MTANTLYHEPTIEIEEVAKALSGTVDTTTLPTSNTLPKYEPETKAEAAFLVTEARIILPEVCETTPDTPSISGSVSTTPDTGMSDLALPIPVIVYTLEEDTVDIQAHDIQQVNSSINNLRILSPPSPTHEPPHSGRKIAEHDVEQLIEQVDEYAADIAAYLKEAEITAIPNPNYMAHQDQITWIDRDALVDWIIGTHHRLDTEPLESLFLGINIIDRFLSKRIVSKRKLTLLATCALFIASKYESRSELSIETLYSSSRARDWPMSHIHKGEMIVLNCLEWRVSSPGPVEWIKRAARAEPVNNAVKTLVVEYLTVVSYADHRMIKYAPSLKAAAAIWLSLLVDGQTEWTHGLAHSTTYEEGDIVSIAECMLDYVVLDPTPHPMLFKKYNSVKNHKSSSRVREWALCHWAANSNVRLEGGLSFLKARPKVLEHARYCRGLGYCC